MIVSSLVLNRFTHDARVFKTCQFLLSQGHQVNVIALHDADLPMHELLCGLKIWRVKLITRNLSKRALIQAVKYVEWLAKACWQVRNTNVLHCNDMNTLPVGVLIKLLTFGRIKVVYDAHEFESNQVPYQSRLSIRLLQIVEGLLIRFADAVITVSDGIAEEYARLYKIEKPVLVLNCPPYQEVQKKNLFREELGISSDRTIFLYQGGLAKGRGIEILLDAFAELESSKVIVFMGYGPLDGMIREYAGRRQNIFFYPAVGPDVLLSYTSSADFGISTIENSCLSYYFCLPNKMFEYIMAGLPVIVSNLPEMKRVVEENGIGVVAKENTAEGLREAIQCATNLDKEKLKAGIASCKSRYNWEDQEQRLKAIYNGL